MKIICKAGDIVDEEVDVLVSSGNIYLNLSGGVGGEIVHRGGRDVQAELHQYLKDNNIKYVKPGFVLRVNPGPTKAKHVLYAVAVDLWYNSSIELVSGVIKKALGMADELGAKTVALPALATGYGRLKMEEFAKGLQDALTSEYPSIEELRIVLKNNEAISKVEKVLVSNVDADLPLPPHLR